MIKDFRALLENMQDAPHFLTIYNGMREFINHYINKMYFSHWMPPGVSERIWSVNIDASISGEYQTLGGYSCRPSESLGAPATSPGVPTTSLRAPVSAGDMSGNTLNQSRADWEKQHLLWERC
jgi:hypothetical protein